MATGAQTHISLPDVVGRLRSRETCRRQEVQVTTVILSSYIRPILLTVKKQKWLYVTILIR